MSITSFICGVGGHEWIEHSMYLGCKYCDKVRKL